MAMRSALVVATVVIIATAGSSSASARSRSSSPQCVGFENPADLYRIAEVVFIGTLVSTQPTGNSQPHSTRDIATFKVERSWKARLPPEIHVGSDRAWPAAKQFLVFAGGKPLSASTLCHWAQPVDAAKDRLDWLSRTVKLVDIYAVMLRQGYHGVAGFFQRNAR